MIEQPVPPMEPTEWIQWICSSQNIEQVRDKYNQWATTYDSNVNEVWTPVPVAVAALANKYISNKSEPILDIGAGTGLVGLALSSLGFQHLIAVDLSSAMLDKAREKGVYQKLICSPIDSSQVKNLDKVQAIIAAGVFAESQAGASELLALQSCIQANGLIIITARQSFLPLLQEAIEQLRWKPIETQTLAIYEDPMHILVFQIPNTAKPLPLVVGL